MLPPGRYLSEFGHKNCSLRDQKFCVWLMLLYTKVLASDAGRRWLRSKKYEIHTQPAQLIMHLAMEGLSKYWQLRLH